MQVKQLGHLGRPEQAVIVVKIRLMLKLTNLPIYKFFKLLSLFKPPRYPSCTLTTLSSYEYSTFILDLKKILCHFREIPIDVNSQRRRADLSIVCLLPNVNVRHTVLPYH